jgi:hypothetical protein
METQGEERSGRNRLPPLCSPIPTDVNIYILVAVHRGKYYLGLDLFERNLVVAGPAGEFIGGGHGLLLYIILRP